jgi:uncharacterized protein (TIGR00251 family)
MKDMDPDVLKRCIKNQDDGVIISIEVKPASKIQAIEGVNRFRDTLNVRILEVAQKGRANSELVRYISEILSIPAWKIAIIKGATSRRKKIRIEGITQDELIRRMIQFITEKER